MWELWSLREENKWGEPYIFLGSLPEVISEPQYWGGVPNRTKWSLSWEEKYWGIEGGWDGWHLQGTYNSGNYDSVAEY